MKTVYIVDDSILIRERLMEMLSGLTDTRVIGETGDPLEALDGILILHPDIVILDVQLPGKSGIELLKDIQSAGIRTHVIILTNYAYPQYERECLEAGADFFLSKVRDFDLLPSILHSMEVEPQGDEESREDFKGLPFIRWDRPP